AEDEYDEYEVEEASGYMLGADGTPVMVSYEIYRFYTYQTTYYVKITDSLYARYATIDDKNFKDWLDFENDSIRKDFYTAGFESLTLPDGNVLSVIGRDSDSEYCVTNGYEAVYGYAKTADGLFIQTIAYTKDGKTVEVKYNGAVEKITVSLDRLYDVQKYLTKKDGTYTVSASLINEIKKLCADEQLGFYFNANGKKTAGATKVNYHYALGMQTNGAEITLDNYFGGGFVEEGSDDFYDYFNSIKRGEASVALDENGNLILYYKDGSVITDLSFSFNGTFPADALLKKNESMSQETGLQIYSYKTENLYDAHRGSFIYENGKYYDYDTEHTYDVSTVATEKFLAGCEIYSMHYQFDIYPSEDLGALPVYSTELRFGENIDGSSYRMTVYTFFLDGKLQVAKQARQTGNSLLTFESYQPFSEYVASLEAVLETEYGYSSYYYYLGNNRVTVYEANLAVYETDGKGNRLYNPDSGETGPYTTISVQYLKKNGNVEIICASEHLGNVLIKGAQVTSFDFDESLCEKSFEQTAFYNTEAEIVFFYREAVREEYYNFIKLAGKYYDYDSAWLSAYIHQRITEAQFTQTSRDLVWYYMVVNPDTDERSFYTEFIPSDYGFKPAGKQLDESELGSGYYEDETLLGYTEEGYELYEVAYYTDSASEEAWTIIDQGDGTVFYHVNGKGYLRDQLGYFVPARQITNEDGKTEIVCMIRGAYVHDEYLNDNEEVLSKFISLSKGGSSLTLTRELLDFAKYNRQHFRFAYTVDNGWSWHDEYVDYDKLSILFLTAEQQ
ncbi:MAG: hypothetical protein IKM52_01500, partial [Clostridia bacterium]|nr:hypothetical protein [Clostridia bacterium]